MAWTIKYTRSFQKEVKKIDQQLQRKIKSFFEDPTLLENPRQKGKALTRDLSGLWRYRIEDFRIICEIQDSELVVLVLKAGHRSKIYTRK